MTSSSTDLSEIFSDESSFYGDDDEQARLEEQVATYDPEPYWSQYHSKLLSTMQNELLAPPAPEKSSPDPDTPMPDVDACDPPARLPRNKRGATESLASFLARLPPSRTVLPRTQPWIWARGSSDLTSSLKKRDEPNFLQKGTELLHGFEETLSELRAAHDKSGAKTTAALTRKLNPIRRDLEKNILALAHETGVTAGKWMLFPSVKKVDSTWATLVTALDTGKVQADAKVAADDGSGSEKSRLICVYTENFADKENVKKVLRMLLNEGIFEPAATGPIYYKSDAFTLLNINSKNEYGLKASMFSSRDFGV
ncbi:hypothetical protein N7454_010437 [Penicillium verhagenii]|nr:hypothetical protein N7454_010437 [Penicillium verhagenii]